MPASTEKQREFMGAELRRLRAGQKTRTGMSEEQLRDFARKPIKKKKRKKESWEEMVRRRLSKIRD